MADAEAPPATEAVSAKDKAIHAEQAAVAKANAFEKRLVADGACCAKFPTLFGAYAKQLHGCSSHHHISDDEKTGLLWFKQADKGCGSFGTAHHAFLSYVTMTVWLELIVGGLMFVVMLLEDGVQISADATPAAGVADVSDSRVSPVDTLISIVCQVIFAYIWNYVGYWALDTGNGIWSILYLIVQLVWSITILMAMGNCFTYMQELAVTTPAMSAGSVTIPATTYVVKESAPLFIVPAIGYVILFVAAIHTVIFGAITLSKLHHGGTNTKPVVTPSNVVAPEP